MDILVEPVFMGLNHTIYLKIGLVAILLGTALLTFSAARNVKHRAYIAVTYIALFGGLVALGISIVLAC